MPCGPPAVYPVHPGPQGWRDGGGITPGPDPGICRTAGPAPGTPGSGPCPGTYLHGAGGRPIPGPGSSHRHTRSQCVPTTAGGPILHRPGNPSDHADTCDPSACPPRQAHTQYASRRLQSALPVSRRVHTAPVLPQATPPSWRDWHPGPDPGPRTQRPGVGVLTPVRDARKERVVRAVSGSRCREGRALAAGIDLGMVLGEGDQSVPAWTLARGWAPGMPGDRPGSGVPCPGLPWPRCAGPMTDIP